MHKADLRKDRVIVLVFDRRKLVFIHIQKTGGSTGSTLLKEHIPDIYEVGMRHQFASKGVQEVKNWDGYFKFAFVRNLGPGWFLGTAW